MRIAKVLEEMHRGAVTAQADTELAKAIAAVKEHGKAAEVTIKVKIEPSGGDEVSVTAECSSKLPKPKARPAIFFMTENNDLTRDDPKQTSLPLSEEGASEKVTPMPGAKAS